MERCVLEAFTLEENKLKRKEKGVSNLVETYVKARVDLSF